MVVSLVWVGGFGAVSRFPAFPAIKGKGVKIGGKIGFSGNMGNWEMTIKKRFLYILYI
jgi:hypothetical protein